MNKIQRAIYNAKSKLEELKRQMIELTADINAYEDHIEALERIERDNSIPHVEIIQNNIAITAGANTFSTTPDFPLTGTQYINK